MVEGISPGGHGRSYSRGVADGGSTHHGLDLRSLNDGSTTRTAGLATNGYSGGAGEHSRSYSANSLNTAPVDQGLEGEISKPTKMATANIASSNQRTYPEGSWYLSTADPLRGTTENAGFDLADPKDHSSWQSYAADSEAPLVPPKSKGTHMGLEYKPRAQHASTTGQEGHLPRWRTITILVFSIYSTVFSGIWLGVALAKPHYGKLVGTGSQIAPQTASLIAVIGAKSIELSFLTVFVVFLGQVLSRRTYATRRAGITLAELYLKTWVVQPGNVFINWEALRHTGVTFLGVMSLIAAVCQIFYTTASDALVAPTLTSGMTANQVLWGRVSTSYANALYTRQKCETPISVAMDQDYSGSTCIQIEHAGQSYHNYLQYLAKWTEFVNAGNSSQDLAQRPPAVAM
jgi:hypothetical protein